MEPRGLSPMCTTAGQSNLNSKSSKKTRQKHTPMPRLVCKRRQKKQKKCTCANVIGTFFNRKTKNTKSWVWTNEKRHLAGLEYRRIRIKHRIFVLAKNKGTLEHGEDRIKSKSKTCNNTKTASIIEAVVYNSGLCFLLPDAFVVKN